MWAAIIGYAMAIVGWEAAQGGNREADEPGILQFDEYVVI